MASFHSSPGNGLSPEFMWDLYWFRKVERGRFWLIDYCLDLLIRPHSTPLTTLLIGLLLIDYWLLKSREFWREAKGQKRPIPLVMWLIIGYWLAGEEWKEAEFWWEAKGQKRPIPLVMWLIIGYWLAGEEWKEAEFWWEADFDFLTFDSISISDDESDVLKTCAVNS